MSKTKDCNLQDLKALVTGATSGLGKAIALRLANAGAEVVVQAATRSQMVEAIGAEGGSARFVAADLSDPASIVRAREVGDIDILINNAGFWGGRTQCRIRHGHVRSQRSRAFLSRGGVCAGDGHAWDRKHHRHRQHGWEYRSGRRGVRRIQRRGTASRTRSTMSLRCSGRLQNPYFFSAIPMAHTAVSLPLF